MNLTMIVIRVFIEFLIAHVDVNYLSNRNSIQKNKMKRKKNKEHNSNLSAIYI